MFELHEEEKIRIKERREGRAGRLRKKGRGEKRENIRNACNYAHIQLLNLAYRLLIISSGANIILVLSGSYSGKKA